MSNLAPATPALAVRIRRRHVAATLTNASHLRSDHRQAEPVLVVNSLARIPPLSRHSQLAQKYLPKMRQVDHVSK